MRYGLARLSGEQGHYDQAEPLYQQALRIGEQAGGEQHSVLVHPLSGLGRLRKDQGNYEQAEAFLERALRIRETSLGLQHPKTAEILHDLAICRQKQGKLSEAASLAQLALKIHTQSLGDAHPTTVATFKLYIQLFQLHVEDFSEAREAEVTSLLQEEQQVGKLSFSPPLTVDHLHTFLNTCCQLHPYAWSRSRDLWQAYERWVEERQERFPLSRRAFSAQLKGRGCRSDRTSTERIWRGISIVKKEP